MEARHMVLIVYNNQADARKMHKRLNEIQDEYLMTVESAAVIVKDPDGTVKVDNKADVEAGMGTLAGAIAGGLLGLLTGSGGAVTDAATGAATGGASAALIDMGLDNDLLDKFKADLQPDSSALIAIMREQWDKHFEESLTKEIGDSVSHYYHDIEARVIDKWNRTTGAPS